MSGIVSLFASFIDWKLRKDSIYRILLVNHHCFNSKACLHMKSYNMNLYLIKSMHKCHISKCKVRFKVNSWSILACVCIFCVLSLLKKWYIFLVLLMKHPVKDRISKHHLQTLPGPQWDALMLWVWWVYRNCPSSEGVHKNFLKIVLWP